MAPPAGYASVTLLDNEGSSVLVPGVSIQLVIGTSSSGPTTLVATRNPSTLLTTYSYGPLAEAAGLTASVGGTVLAIQAATTTPGAKTAVTFTGSGTSVVTVTGTPFDTGFYIGKVLVAGTIGTTGILVALSADGGRTWSPPISLGTATSYAWSGTGLTLNFGAGTLVLDDTFQFSTTEPLWNTAGILYALETYAASPYAIQPIGSVHIVGGSTAGGVPGADITSIGGYLEGSVVGAGNLGQPLFNDAVMTLRDASPPLKWGGTGETEAAWMTAILASVSGVAEKRTSACGGFYNTPSVLASPLGALWRYRRPLAWSIAARMTQIQPQRSAGRVKDGPLTTIVVDPINDPLDGFIYHNDAGFAPSGLGDFRIVAGTTRSGKGSAYFARGAPTMAAIGSQYAQRPYMAVADFAANILQSAGTDLINDDIRILPAGSLDPRDALTIQNGVGVLIKSQMVGTQMISAFTVSVDTTNNVQTTGNINIALSVTYRAIVITVTGTFAFTNPTT